MLGVGWEQTAPKPVQLLRAGERSKENSKADVSQLTNVEETAWHEILAPNSTGLSRVSGVV